MMTSIRSSMCITVVLLEIICASADMESQVEYESFGGGDVNDGGMFNADYGTGGGGEGGGKGGDYNGDGNQGGGGEGGGMGGDYGDDGMIGGGGSAGGDGDCSMTCPDSNICINVTSLCNGVVECPNREDEFNCTNSGCPLTCPGTSVCIYSTYICNAVHDCPNGFDELDCGNGSETSVMSGNVLWIIMMLLIPDGLTM